MVKRIQQNKWKTIIMETLLYYFLLPAFFGGLVVLILLLAYQYQQWEDKQ